MGAAIRPSFFLSIRMTRLSTLKGKYIYQPPPIRFMILIAVLVFSACPALSRTVFPVNTEGKIGYVKYIKHIKDSFNQNILLSQRVFNQIESNSAPDKKDTFDALTGDFTRTFNFTVYRKGLVTKNPAGEVTGVITLYMTPNSVMIRVEDIKYTQLQKNRYAQYNPGGRKSVPLEKLTGLHNSQAWQEIFSRIDNRINEILNKAEQVFNYSLP